MSADGTRRTGNKRGSKAVRVFGSRELLNRRGFESTGAIVAEITETSYGWDVTCQISDCSRAAALTFEDPAKASTERFENDIEKINRIIDVMTEFKRAMRAVRKLGPVEDDA